VFMQASGDTRSRPAAREGLMSRGMAMLLAGLLVDTLVACAAPPALQQQAEAACMAYGLQPETPDFSSCLQRETLARRYGGGSGVSLGFGFFGGF
jgi:hypothetical protein